LGGIFGGSRERERPEINAQEAWKQEEGLSLEERRARYHCIKFVEFKDIKDWATVSKKQSINESKAEKESKFSPDEQLNKKVALWHGDITTLEIDAIVNAANESCLGGGGIDGAIHRAAGDKLYEECRTLHGCSTGQTKITRGYDLPAKYILHTVGPTDANPANLELCYNTCLELVVKHNIRSVAFCGISTGIFGFPLYPASRIALETVRKWLEKDDNKNKVDLIIFCTFLPKEKVCYEELILEYFPLVRQKVIQEEKHFIKHGQEILVEQEMKINELDIKLQQEAKEREDREIKEREQRALIEKKKKGCKRCQSTFGAQT